MSSLYNSQDDMQDADYVYDEWLKENMYKPVFDFAREYYHDSYEIDYCIELRNILSGKDSELLTHITIEEADHQFNERMVHILSVSIMCHILKNNNNG
jgi:hypothetical protein